MNSERESANIKVGYFEDIACTFIFIVLKCTHEGRKTILDKRINELRVIKKRMSGGFFMKKAYYWKVVLHYGHVGSHKEISVARYLYFKDPLSLIEVCDFAKEMPGVKHSQMVSSVKQITREDFLIGKKNEKTDFFLIKLQSHRSAFSAAIA